jgi:aminopeptidase N
MFVQMRGNDRLRYDYVTHMIAHAWFAGLTNYAHITEAWLNEGFATYLHILWKGEREGIEAFRREMASSRGRVARFDVVGTAQPMVNTEIPEPGAIYSFGAGAVYFKGAWVLHMLRRELGDETFWRGVHGFLETNRGRGVVTSDLQRAFQQTSGRDLNAFFDQWVYRGGTPRLDISYKWLAERRVLEIQVEQDQQIDAENPPFKLPLDLRFTVGGQVRDHRLDLTQATQRFEFECPQQPESVRFDPDVWALAVIRVDSATSKPARE